MIAKEHQDRLPDLKKMVTDWHEYFKKNIERYNDFMKFVFCTSLTNDDIQKLKTLGKPTLEFNILEAYINQLRGQFLSQTPNITAKIGNSIDIFSIDEKWLQQIEVLEGYLREMLISPKADGLQNKLYQDVLGGGYSVAEVYTEYSNQFTFDQDIKCDRVFDPTLTGFDPLARLSHKGDGNYCFQLYPRTRDEFEAEFGKEATKDCGFTRSNTGFNWSYTNQQQDIVLLCDFFEKKKQQVKIVKLSNGKIIRKKHYTELLKIWEDIGYIEQPPLIVNERWAEAETIVRYQFCESKVLSYTQTAYTMLPLVFIDGNSVYIKRDKDGATEQMTRPYVYHAKGIQRLKNFSGQTVGSEIENMVQHKFKVAVESIPDDYEEAYRNVQQADTLMYNAFLDGNPQIPLPPPQEIMRVPVPPIVQETFIGTDRLTEVILGSYNSTMGTNSKDVSGVAIANGSIQTGAAAAPYLQGYINGLNRLAEVITNLIPKYYVTPRTLPIITSEGKRSYQIINNDKVEGSVKFNYRPHDLEIEVEAGVNNNLQKMRNLELLTNMMQASPMFAEFINAMGLEVILENLDINNIEVLKAKAVEFMQMQKEAQEQASQQQDPQIEVMQQMNEVEMAKVEQKAQQAEDEMAIEAARVAIEKQKVDAQVMEILSKIENNEVKTLLEQERVDAENARSAVEAAIKLSEVTQEERRENEQELD